MYRNASMRLVAAIGLAVVAAAFAGAAPAQATTIPPGAVRVFPIQSTPPDTQPSKTIAARCPAGQRVLGGGAFTVGGVHAVITELQPISDANGDRFQVSAAADQFGIAGAWSIQAFALCAVVPAALQYEIKARTNPPTSAATDQAGTVCSAGKQIVGAGGRIENGNGQVDLGLFTNGSGAFTNGTASFAKEDADGYAGLYRLSGYSVCVRPALISDVQQVKTTNPATSAPSQTATRACPSGLRLTGLAGGTVAPGTHLQRLTPNQVIAPNLAFFGAQSSTPPTEPWIMEATIFCAR